MSKKITAVALVALMLLVALPANAAIQATSVEVRGSIAEPVSDPTFRAGMLDSGTNATWSPFNFAGFYYDLKDNIATENLQIVSGGLSGRTIALDNLLYSTQGQAKVLKVVQNGGTTGVTSGTSNGLEHFGAGEMSGTDGAYNIVGWQALPYVGIKNHPYKLAKLLIEQGNATSEKKSLTVGETWDIGGGWTVTANSIDAKASPRQVWLTLSKDGVKKDDKVVAQGKAYTYVEKNIGGESDVPLFVTYIDSVFAGATSDMVQLRYTWAIDTSITEVKGGDTYGVFKVKSTDPVVVLQNDDNTVTLSKDTTVDLMGGMKFRTADSDTVRFYPMVVRTDPGTWEVRGAVAEPISDPTFRAGMLDSGTNATWNPFNFAGFYYDLKDNIATENLQIVSGGLSGRTIALDNLLYSTQGQAKVLKVVQNGGTTGVTSGTSNGLEHFGAGEMSGTDGAYNIVGWQAQPYVGIKNHPYKLAKLLIEQGNATSEKKSLTVGETWDIGGGWTVTANSIDAKASPRQVWLTLSKDGVKKDDKVVAQGKAYTYVEKNIGGESDVPLFVTYIDSVFAGATSDMVQLRYTWAVDTSITEVKGGDTYGVFKVKSTDPVVALQNDDNTVTLSKDTTVDLMGEMKFHVADSDVVRFYPMVTYQIGAVTTGTATPTMGTATATGTAKPTGNMTPAMTEKVTPAMTTAVMTTAATPAATKAPKEPGFEAVFAIAGLLAVAYLVLRQRK